VPGLNVDKRSFRFANPQAGEINGRYISIDLTRDLRQVLGNSVDGQLILVLGRLGLKNGALSKIHDATFLAHPSDNFMPAARKLGSLHKLADGWMGEGSLRPQTKTLALAGAVLTVVRHVGLTPPPGIFPTEEGGVLFEWATSDYIFSIEVEADSSIVAYSLYPQEERGESVPVNAPILLDQIIKDWVPVIND